MRASHCSQRIHRSRCASVRHAIASRQRLGSPWSIGRSNGVEGPPPHAACESNMPCLKFFWSGYDGRGCIFAYRTLNNGPMRIGLSTLEYPIADAPVDGRREAIKTIRQPCVDLAYCYTGRKLTGRFVIVFRDI
jgi:hypothetical protein